MLSFAVAAATALFAETPPQTSTSPTTTEAKPNVPDGGVPTYITPETPQQRKERLGTAEDPGPDPDPSQHFWRYGHSYHIEKFDRRFESYEGVEPGYVRPYGFLNVQKEIYQRNDKYVWVWMPDPEPENDVPTPQASRYNSEQLNYLQDMRKEFTAVTPKRSDKTVRFEESSEGLPTDGSWRNSPAVADMNGDGCPDIVAPPERKGLGIPSIFLGDCKGHWTRWKGVTWPHAVDYGNVVAADFNKDGHMDLAFGVHLQGVYVMLGDGKGHFTESTKGLPHPFPTRRVVAADMDHDGYPDLVAISEGAITTAGPNGSAAGKGKVRVFFNRKKGMAWEEKDLAGESANTAGDWMTVANLTRGAHPDVIAATTYMNSNEVLYVSEGKKGWKPIRDAYLVPYLSMYFANTAGHFTSKNYEDAIVSYGRVWPNDVPTNVVPDPELKQVVGIDRVTLVGKKPQRVPIVRWSSLRGVAGLAAGDFDHDGKLDLIYTRYDPREAVILLGDGKGGFEQANVTGLKLRPNTNYDVTVADVNGDGLPDVIVMYESSSSTTLAETNGAIQVFLNRGAVREATTEGKTASK